VLLRIDPHRGPPIFEQIVFAVKRAVAQGQLAPGDKLASVRELAGELAVNPNTVVRALEVLAHDGVIVRRQGAGCFIAERAPELNGRVRKQKLDELLQRAVTEAFHLGFDADQVRSALERRLADVSFDDKTKS
jgi:GntR family transcriptional regulator